MRVGYLTGGRSSTSTPARPDGSRSVRMQWTPRRYIGGLRAAMQGMMLTLQRAKREMMRGASAVLRLLLNSEMITAPRGSVRLRVPIVGGVDYTPSVSLPKGPEASIARARE